MYSSSRLINIRLGWCLSGEKRSSLFGRVVSEGENELCGAGTRGVPSVAGSWQLSPMVELKSWTDLEQRL